MMRGSSQTVVCNWCRETVHPGSLYCVSCGLPVQVPLGQNRSAARLRAFIYIVLACTAFALLLGAYMLRGQAEAFRIFAALVALTALVVFLVEMWRRQIPFRRWGSEIHPRDRPVAYHFCMAFITLSFGSLTASGWVHWVKGVF